jgi:hypothetical protein
MPEYKILIESTDQQIEGSLDPNDQDESTNKKLKKKKKDREPAFDASGVIKQIYKAQSIYATAEPIISGTVQTISQRNYLQGETLKAQRLNTSYSNLTQNIQLGFTIGITLLTANPIAIAATAYQFAQRAYQVSLETQRYTVEQNKDRYKQQYLSQRLVRNISEVR